MQFVSYKKQQIYITAFSICQKIVRVVEAYTLSISFPLLFFIIYIAQVDMHREKCIPILRIFQYSIFHHTMIETSFEMLKSSEHEIS